MENETKTPSKPLNLKVGVATIVKDKDGNVIEAMFNPLLKIKDCTHLVEELKKVGNKMETQAQLIVATWFDNLNFIESAERDKFHMVTTPLESINMQETFPQNTYPENSIGYKFLFSFEEIV